METTPGARTRNEIFSQPRCWSKCFEALDKSRELYRAVEGWGPRTGSLFIGCGSSYYVAQAAAASWTMLTGEPARAMPASELLLFPSLTLPASPPFRPVLISRSGHTSEVLKVAEWLERKQDLRTVAISCTANQPLEEICTLTLHLLPADEQSVVMTRSFTSMLLGLQALAAEHGRQCACAKALRRLPDETQPWVEPLAERLEDFVQAHVFADYVFLGQGPLFGIASEGMLKVKEMSCSYAQCFHTLEFRHGPRAIVSRETLVTFLLSESGYIAEREVLEEVKGLGGTTLVVANCADAATRRMADFLVELNLTVPECARLAAYALPVQLLGLLTGLKKNRDPDRPRHLSRVVILGSAESNPRANQGL